MAATTTKRIQAQEEEEAEKQEEARKRQEAQLEELIRRFRPVADGLVYDPLALQKLEVEEARLHMYGMLTPMDRFKVDNLRMQIIHRLQSYVEDDMERRVREKEERQRRKGYWEEQGER